MILLSILNELEINDQLSSLSEKEKEQLESNQDAIVELFSEVMSQDGDKLNDIFENVLNGEDIETALEEIDVSEEEWENAITQIESKLPQFLDSNAFMTALCLYLGSQ